MKNIAGSVVYGPNFLNRGPFLKRLEEELESEVGALILSPRRAGKTSAIHEFGRKQSEAGWRCIYFSVAGLEDELAVDAELRRQLKQVAEKPLRRKLEKIDETDDWSTAGRATIETLLSDNKPTLICIDELAVFVLDLLKRDVPRAARFLQWLRDLRQLPGTQKVRWIIAGSIGLDTLAEQFGLSETINDIDHLKLGPFSVESAYRMLDELSHQYSYGWEEGAQQVFLQKIGWLIPYHIQMLFKEIRYAETIEKGQAIGAADIDLAFDAMLGPERKKQFETWVQRLTKELGQDCGRTGIEILNTIARIGGCAPEALHRIYAKHMPRDDNPTIDCKTLLRILVNDGYLMEEAGQYVFLSPVLRAFWQRHEANK